MEVLSQTLRSKTDYSLGVGDTPLIPLRRLTRGISERIQIFAKLEWFNPGGSVKDRPAIRMIREAERSGLLKPGKVILDATSGNTGIAYAWIGAKLGYKVRLAVAGNINTERKKVLLAYGADLIFTDPLEGSDGAIRKAREMYQQSPELYFYADQYNNEENWKAHYETTGQEIWDETEGTVTHFIAGLGTSGTFRGTGTRLRDFNHGIKLISVQPNSPLHGLEGLKHMETSIVPGIYDPDLADENLFISTEEAQDLVIRAAREEGLLIGVSGGANTAASLRIGGHLYEAGEKAVLVTVIPDSGERYLSERFWEEKL